MEDERDVYVYVGLDRRGNVVDVRRGGDGTPGPPLDDLLDDYEVISAIEVLRRKKSTAGEGPGSDPDCIRGPDGRVRCF